MSTTILTDYMSYRLSAEVVKQEGNEEKGDTNEDVETGKKDVGATGLLEHE